MRWYVEPLAYDQRSFNAAALRLVDDLVASGRLASSHLLPRVRGELLRRLGRDAEARHELAAAVRLCPNPRERELLQRKLAALG
jgi:predicted RNA polymerase sigma factor